MLWFTFDKSKILFFWKPGCYLQIQTYLWKVYWKEKVWWKKINLPSRGNIRCRDLIKNLLYFTAFQGCWPHFSMTPFSFHSTFCVSWIPHQQPSSLAEKCWSLYQKGHSGPPLTSCGRCLLKKQKMIVSSLSFDCCIVSKT